MTGTRGVDGVLDHLHLVDVAGTVREDLAHGDADDELRLGLLAQDLVVVANRRVAVDAQTAYPMA